MRKYKVFAEENNGGRTIYKVMWTDGPITGTDWTFITDYTSSEMAEKHATTLRRIESKRS